MTARRRPLGPARRCDATPPAQPRTGPLTRRCDEPFCAPVMAPDVDPDDIYGWALATDGMGGE